MRYTEDVGLIRSEDIDMALNSVALAYEDYPLFNYLICNHSKAAPIKQILLASIKASKSDYVGLALVMRRLLFLLSQTTMVHPHYRFSLEAG